MIAAHDVKVGIARYPQGACLLEMLESQIVLLQLKLAEAKHGPANAAFRLQGEQLVKRLARLGVPILLIKQRTEIPPAFVPGGTHLEGLTIEVNRLRDAIGFSGG